MSEAKKRKIHTPEFKAKVGEARSILQKSELPATNDSFSGINANTAVSALCETTTCPQEVLSFAWEKYFGG